MDTDKPDEISVESTGDAGAAPEAEDEVSSVTPPAEGAIDEQAVAGADAASPAQAGEEEPVPSEPASSEEPEAAAVPEPSAVDEAPEASAADMPAEVPAEVVAEVVAETTAPQAELPAESPEPILDEPAQPEAEPSEPAVVPIAVETDEAVELEGKTVGPEIPDLTLGGGLPADRESPVVIAAPLIRGKIDRHGAAIGTGRRKTSVARVRIKDGSGALAINGRALQDYFKIDQDQHKVVAPLHATGYFGKVDVWARVGGGGTTGQAGAIALGIARALQAKDPGLHGTLSEGGYLTRDGRMVERKKYGYKKARKSFQFSKR